MKTILLFTCVLSLLCSGAAFGDERTPVFPPLDPMETVIYGQAIGDLAIGNRDVFANASAESFTDTFRAARETGDFWTCAVIFLEHQTAISVRISFDLVRGGVPLGQTQPASIPTFDPQTHGGVSWGNWLPFAYIGQAQAAGKLSVTDENTATVLTSMERELFPLLMGS
jgi:hypothetical protein